MEKVKEFLNSICAFVTVRGNYDEDKDVKVVGHSKLEDCIVVPASWALHAYESLKSGSISNIKHSLKNKLRTVETMDEYTDLIIQEYEWLMTNKDIHNYLNDVKRSPKTIGKIDLDKSSI